MCTSNSKPTFGEVVDEETRQRRKRFRTLGGVGFDAVGEADPEIPDGSSASVV